MNTQLVEVEDLLWTVLEGHAPWAELILPGNRVKLTGTNPDPNLDSRMASDLPAAFIFHAPFQFNAFGGSGSSTITANYTLVVQTDEQRTGGAAHTRAINIIKMETFIAFEKYRLVSVQPLAYMIPGTLILIDATPENRAAEGSRPGWASICNIQIKLKWLRATLVA